VNVRIALSAALLLALTAAAGRADTLHVPAAYPTIQGAIDAAAPGDVILVSPGTYCENIDFTGKAITVRGAAGPDGTIIDGGRLGSVVTFAGGEGADSVLEGFEITNGTGTPGLWSMLLGGGIHCAGSSPTIRNNTIALNTANIGGGICLENASPEIADCMIRRNSAYKGGGICCLDGSSPVIVNSLIIRNIVQGNGGGISCWNRCAAVIASSTISENRAGDGGGIFCTRLCTLTVANSVLWNNEAWDGPEIYIGSAAYPSTLSIGFSDVEGGQASAFVEAGCLLDWSAGMIDADPLFVNPSRNDFHLAQGSPCIEAGDNGAVLLPPLDFEGHPRTWNGTADLGADEFYPPRTLAVPGDHAAIQDAVDGAYNGDTVLVDPGVYVENVSFKGKVLDVRSSRGPKTTVIDGGQAGSAVTFANGEGPGARIEGFTISNGSAAEGGGIFCHESFPEITGNVVAGNSAGSGGGIFCRGAGPAITNNTVENNTASLRGGGLACAACAAPRVDGNVFLNNQALEGGAVACSESSPLLTSNLLAGNSADDGGGVFCFDSSPTITNNSVTSNTASLAGGGVCCDGASPLITNTILWNNTAPAGSEIHVLSGSPDVSYCDVEGGWPGTGNIDANPQFYGPLLGDFHIVISSPCFDAGSNAAPDLPETDFEGDQRSAYTRADIGADEFFNHLYVIGDPVPDKWIDFRFVGTPYSDLTLALSTTLLDKPKMTKYGLLWLEFPLTTFYPAPIPSCGIQTFPMKVPVTWVPGEEYYFQTLVGAKLTNLVILVAEAP